jgi:hypothetical protein
MARAARTAGWKVVAITMIARGNYFADAAHQNQFPVNQAALNSLLLNSQDFDAIVNPSLVLTDPANTTYFYDGCHLLPAGYQIVAQLVIGALKSLWQ